MKNNTHISDQELNQLLNQICISALIAGLFLTGYYFYQPCLTNQDPAAKSKAAEVTSHEPTVRVETSKIIKTRIRGPVRTSSNYSLEFHTGQLIENIFKENADCTTPVLVKDTVVFSPNTPIGIGNELEFLNNAPNDVQYLENEHNTVWYKFWPPEDGVLTFDIIPVDPNDDYDFMLFRYDGGDFHSKILSKELKPIRSCISRNDTAIQGKTGLSMNEPTTYFIHSGIGQSYVKYVQVKKGETFYLLVDNVYRNGNGHMLHFHYTPFDSNKPYVGKTIEIENVMFKAEEYEFEKGATAGLDNLYRFLVNNPNLKVEIQGHVNTGHGAAPHKYSYQDLSDYRAQAIYNYLIERGIPKERLTAVGYADHRKKIVHPMTIKEYRRNILADMFILSLDWKADLEWQNMHRQPSAPH
ncbi:MAG TPA: OmpA family protein [Bacteroidia bacterium]|jgi:hypothetical protein|nr:OmpA family protein [Bacteroidia bacterium]